MFCLSSGVSHIETEIEVRGGSLNCDGYHDALRTLEATEDVLLGITKPREHIPHCQACEGWLCGRECSRAGWL